MKLLACPAVSDRPPTGSPVHEITRRDRVGYGVGSIGTGIFSTVPGLVLLYYLTDVLGVAAGLAGALLVVPKAWDVVLAPLIGRRLDRGGVRTRWMGAAAWVLAPAFALMFVAPVDGTLGGLWVGSWFLVAASAFVFFQIPYVALPARMTDDPGERTRTMAWRVGLLAVGILLSGGVGPVISGGADGGRASYAAMGALLAVVAFLALRHAARATAWVPDEPDPAHVPLRVALREGWASPPFRPLLVVHVLQTVAGAVLLAGTPYVATYRLDDHGLTAVLFVALIAPSLLVVPAWRALAERRGKERALLGATALFVIALAVLTLAVRDGAVGASVAVVVVLGIGFTGAQLLPFSRLPDVGASEGRRIGRPVVGSFTGLWAAGETAGAALGPGVYALVLALAGFASSRADERVAQTPAAVDAVLWGWTAIPIALTALSLVVLVRFARRYREAMAADAAATA